MNRNNKTKYTYKQIWFITFPILISLLMEQLIGRQIRLFWVVSVKSSWVRLPLQGYIILLSL